MTLDGVHCILTWSWTARRLEPVLLLDSTSVEALHDIHYNQLRHPPTACTAVCTPQSNPTPQCGAKITSRHQMPKLRDGVHGAVKRSLRAPAGAAQRPHRSLKTQQGLVSAVRLCLRRGVTRSSTRVKPYVKRIRVRLMG